MGLVRIISMHCCVAPGFSTESRALSQRKNTIAMRKTSSSIAM